MASKRESLIHAAEAIVRTVAGRQPGCVVDGLDPFGVARIFHPLSDKQDLVLAVHQDDGPEVAIEVQLMDRSTGASIGRLVRFVLASTRQIDIQQTMLLVAGAWRLARTMADNDVAWLMK